MQAVCESTHGELEFAVGRLNEHEAAEHGRKATHEDEQRLF